MLYKLTFQIIIVEANIKPDTNGYYHFGDMILSPGQYQRAYGDSSDDSTLDSGISDTDYRWENGGNKKT